MSIAHLINTSAPLFLSVTALHCQHLRKRTISIFKCLQSFFNTQQTWGREQLEAQTRNWNTPYCSVAIWSQDKEKFHYSRSLCNWVMMGLYYLLTRFSWKLMFSSHSFPCLEADCHCGSYSCLPIPPDTTCSKTFFRDCANGPAVHCEFLKQVAFLWQLYRKKEKRMKKQTKMNLSGCMHTVRNITRQCILWKTHLPGAEIFTPMRSTLWVRPFLRILSNQHDTIWKEEPLSRFAFKITSDNRRLGLLESSQHFRVGSGLAKLINSFGPHHSQRKMTFLFK